MCAEGDKERKEGSREGGTEKGRTKRRCLMYGLGDLEIEGRRKKRK